jgi:hypothetical protein
MTGLSDAHASAKALSTICQSLEAEGLLDGIIAMVEDRLKGQIPKDRTPAVTAAILGSAAVKSSVAAAVKCSDGKKDTAMLIWNLWHLGVMANAGKSLKEALK